MALLGLCLGLAALASRPILFMLANPNGSTAVESQHYSYAASLAFYAN